MEDLQVTTLSAPPARSGLTIAWDTLCAPKTAFTALQIHASWVYAFAIVVVLGTLGSFLQVPAGEHVVTAAFAHSAATDPNLAAMSPAKQKQALGFALLAQRYAWLAYPVIAIVGMLLSAFVLTIANAVGGGRASFGRLFALVANIGIINYGLASLLVGLLVLRLGGDAFTTTRDIVSLLPSLARFAPEHAPKLAMALAAINPFYVWAFVLEVFGMRIVSNVALPVAAFAAFVAVFGSSVIAVFFAK